MNQTQHEYGQYVIGTWNINGFYSVRNPYYMTFKTSVIKYLYFDVLVMPEHHCLNNQVLKLDNYEIFQYNRQSAANINHGSGGIAIAVHRSLLNNHVIMGTYKGIDGQLAIKIKNVENDFTLGILGLYLSPDSFHYGQDDESFFNHCSVLINDLGDCDLLVGAGDVNARTKQLLDFIPDIDGDLLPERVNPDKTKNSHGDAFLTFLKDSRNIILNGRITPEYNNFTFVTSRGCSVPDYLFSPIEHLHFCKTMKTLLMTDIVNQSGLVPPQTLPDHSILQGVFSTAFSNEKLKIRPKEVILGAALPPKRNLKKINPETFFLSKEIQQQVLQTIQKIESASKHQGDIDRYWSEIKNIFLKELNTLPVISRSGVKKDNSKLRKSASFWNAELANLWSNLCANEKFYTKFKVQNRLDFIKKSQLRENYKNAQKQYDKRYRFYKRQSKQQEQARLSIAASDNPNEMWAKLKKLAEPVNTKVAMEMVREDGTISHDVKEILQRWHRDISRLFSGIREDPEVVFDDIFFNEVLQKKREFEELNEEEQKEKGEFSTHFLNADITFDEVSKAVDRAKSGKAYLDIPNEIMKNLNAKLLLQKFFDLCFKYNLSPTDWDFSDIKPIPKKDKDKRDPLQNRCISIICCVAKVYSSILNTRIQKYLEDNQILVEEQNGFRASRSCIDHIFVLCSILRNRKCKNLSTFLTFIDFQKAFDSVDRSLLFFKLSQIGICGPMYNAIAALYSNPRSRIILNEHKTDYFDCPIGVKQGDCLSPTLFSIFINDLATEIKQSGIGVDISIDSNIRDLVGILLYADDIVLIAENEESLQSLLYIVENWCKKWRLELNLTKTNIMHVRKSQKPQSKYWFIFDKKSVPYCTKYKYLGTTINQYLDFKISAEAMCDPAGRALASIISKMIKNSGFPYNVYTNLVDSCVNSISDYGGSVIGYNQHEGPLKIHLRAARAFLGAPKNAVKMAILSEIDWLLPKNRNRIRMIRHLHRMLRMTNDRLTKKVLMWDKMLNNTGVVSSWYSEVKQVLNDCNFQYIYETDSIFPLKQTIHAITNTLKTKQINEIKAECLTVPKLRTYILFKDFETQASFLSKPLNFFQRRAIVNLRIGSFKLNIETQRYFRPKIPYERRFCVVCPNDNFEIENEEHYLFSCTAYNDLRQLWLSGLDKPGNFDSLEINEKLNIVLNMAANTKSTANFILDAFDIRSKVLLA